MKKKKIITVMYCQGDEDATQRKKLKHAGYKSKKKESNVDAWPQHPNLHKQKNTLTTIIKHYF